jgi:putative lipoprotein
METIMQMTMLVRTLVALLLLLVTPAWAGTVTLNGTVTYRERIALPADATLRVTLVRLDGGSPVVGASASIPTRGLVPIAFALNVHTDVDMFDGTHGLTAEISSGETVLFRNSVAVPVTQGAGEPIGILVNFAPQPAPQPEPALPTPDFLEIEWTVTSVGGRPVVGPRPLTLSIAADLRAGGSGGCNNFFTEASIEGETIAFGPPASTRMACEPTIMDQEFAYFVALSAVASFEHDDQGLRLLDAAGIPLVGLVRATE